MYGLVNRTIEQLAVSPKGENGWRPRLPGCPAARR